MYNKYHNKKTIIDGISFDSKAEAARYCQLKLMVRAGIIDNLKLQPKYLLQEAFVKNGKKIQAINYIADFEYIENGKTVIEDVKGVKTKEFSLKLKMFQYRYPDLDVKLIGGRT